MGVKDTILVVDDDPLVREVMRMFLSLTGYTVLEASEGREALAIWEVRRAEIDLLITDMVMPGDLSGLQLAERVLADKPGVKAIITSGYSINSMDFVKASEPRMVYLPKPYDQKTLISMVRTCLERA